MGLAVGTGRRAAALGRIKIINYESSSSAAEDKTDDYSVNEDLDFANVWQEELVCCSLTPTIFGVSLVSFSFACKTLKFNWEIFDLFFCPH